MTLKPKCGFYLTEKFPKSPKLPEGEEVDAVVFYDVKSLWTTTDYGSYLQASERC